jgi:ABC-type glycerol-3-phosphate transport system substrate-binding protein
MIEQIGSGICQDVTQRITEDGFKDTFYPAAVQNFSFDGKYYGLPNDVAPEVLLYNKELCQKAGVDPTQIHYWEDLIEAVKSARRPASHQWPSVAKTSGLCIFTPPCL